ncbi:MAG: transcriptional regulator NrdR [bacterium]
MKCPYCSSEEDKVINSRPQEYQAVIRRRRECMKCHRRFTTYERFEVTHLMVIKSDNRLDPFDKEKVRRGIVRACQKRPVSSETIEKIIVEIEYELQEYVMEVPSSVIGEKVLKKLYDVDSVAYIRFASVYRKFNDVNTFMNELEKLKSKKDSVIAK